MATFNKRLKLVRLMLGIKQISMAREIGISNLQLCYYEIGRYEPNMRFLLRLNAKYNVNLNWLISGYGDIFLGESKNVTVKPSKNVTEDFKNVTVKPNYIS